jgi:methylmalonyl-CoA/ethylmalonyl-CoA epimerase
MRIDHVAIAVNNVDQALKNYEKLIKINKVHIENVTNERVKVAILNLEDTRIELMEPTAQDSPINKFLLQNGEGLHHIAITADNIEEDVSKACENGVKMLGNIRKGSYDRKITFFHPKSMNGVLIEMCEAVNH